MIFAMIGLTIYGALLGALAPTGSPRHRTPGLPSVRRRR